MKNLKKCNFCGKQDFKFLCYGTDKLYRVPGKFKVVKCENCGLIFINPQPSFKELEKYYSPEKYYSFDKIRHKEDDKNVRLKLLLYNLFSGPKNKNYLLKTFLSPIKLLARQTKVFPEAKFLDIGCGAGQFLYEMKQLGIKNVYGVEPGDFNEKQAKKEGLKIKKSDLINANYPEKFFDIITINQVLEHVNNPTEIVEEIYRILKKGGTLIIGVPNTNSWNYNLFKKNWANLDVPRHLFNYSDILLKSYLQKKGFRILKIRYTGNMISLGSIVYSLRNIMSPKISRKLEKIIQKILSKLWMVFALIADRTLNIFKKGDQIEIICTK